jgi:hypothetical protein
MRLLRVARRALPVLFLTPAALAMVGTQTALAQAPPCILWAAAVDGEFEDDSKWTGGIAPAATDDACITVGGAPYTVSLGTSRTVNGLLIGADGKLAVTAPSTADVTLTTTTGAINHGILELDAADDSVAALDPSAGILLSDGTILTSGDGTALLKGSVETSGPLNANAETTVLEGSVVNTGALTMSAAGILRAEGTFEHRVGGTIAGGGAAGNQGFQTVGGIFKQRGGTAPALEITLRDGSTLDDDGTGAITFIFRGSTPNIVTGTIGSAQLVATDTAPGDQTLGTADLTSLGVLQISTRAGSVTTFDITGTLTGKVRSSGGGTAIISGNIVASGPSGGTAALTRWLPNSPLDAYTNTSSFKVGPDAVYRVEGGTFEHAAGGSIEVLSLSSLDVVGASFLQRGGSMLGGTEVRLSGGTTLDNDGTGGGRFVFTGATPNSLIGTVHSSQVVSTDGFAFADQTLNLPASMTNSGRLNLNARAGQVTTLDITGTLAGPLSSSGGGGAVISGDVRNTASSAFAAALTRWVPKAPSDAFLNQAQLTVGNASVFNVEGTFENALGGGLTLPGPTAMRMAPGTTFKQTGGLGAAQPVAMGGGTTLNDDGTGRGSWSFSDPVPSTVIGSLGTLHFVRLEASTAPTSVNVPDGFSSSGIITLAGAQTPTILVGGGTGTLVNEPAGDIVVQGGPAPANIDGILENRGEVFLTVSRHLAVDAYTQSSFAFLRVPLQSAGPGGFGVLDVAGAATLGGTLQVDPVGGFVPAAPDRFQVVTYASRSGAFQPTQPYVNRVLLADHGPTNLTLSVVVCTITGSSIKDNLVGSKTAADVLCGQGNDDSLNGLGGNDVLYGGPGKDVLAGGKGDDYLDGGTEADTAAFYDSGVTGTLTASLVTGQATNAILGTDTMVMNTIENLAGSPGDDELTGDGQNNVLDGRPGNDTLSGGDGTDTLLGGAGNDVLSGGNDADRIQPGPDDDEVDGGGAGFAGDTVDYGNGVTGGVDVQLTAAGGTASGNGGNAGADVLTDIENVYGTPANDTIGANLPGQRSLLLGLAGDDKMTTVDGDGQDQIIDTQGANTCTKDVNDASTCTT